jgi:rhodanese-related sulfurtransferase
MEATTDRRPALRTTHWLLAPVVFAIVSFTVACGGEEAVQIPAAVEGEVTSIDSAQGRALIDAGGALVIDVRSLDEYTSGHLVGAQSIPFEDEGLWLTRIDPLDRERATVVYAATVDDSAVAARRLVDEGFTKVYDLGGVGDWDPEDLRVEA